MKSMYPLLSLFCAISSSNCASEGDAINSQNLERAEQTMGSLYQNYSAPYTCLLREKYPLDETYTNTDFTGDTSDSKKRAVDTSRHGRDVRPAHLHQKLRRTIIN